MRLGILFAAVFVTGCSPIIGVVGRMFRPSTDGWRIVVDQTTSANTEDASDKHEPTCNGGRGDAPDHSWLFDPPADGRYRIHVESEYDAVLAVYDDADAELACNDDHESTADAEVVLELSRGRTYTIVVDGYGEARGAYDLAVTAADGGTEPVLTDVPQDGGQSPGPSGPDPNCPSAIVLRPGRTTVQLDARPSTTTTLCGAGAGPEIRYRIDVGAPSTLVVRLESTFDGVLELRRGCHADAIACVDDVGDIRHSAIETHVDAGTYYLILDSVSDGSSGTGTLDVTVTPDGQPRAEGVTGQ